MVARRMTRDELRLTLDLHGVRLKPKAKHWLLRWFAPRYWQACGRSIYYPAHINNPMDCEAMIRHELVHIKQQKSYGCILFLLLYCLVPLPFGLAYYRWKFEREAYLINIQLGEMTPTNATEILSRYAWPWPKMAIYRWFTEHADD